MEIAAIAVAGIALLIAVYNMRKVARSTKAASTEPVAFFDSPPKKRGKRMPTVRDDLAAWRREQQEKLEWESELKRKEAQDYAKW